MNETSKERLQSFSILAKRINDSLVSGTQPTAMLKEFASEETSIANIAKTYGSEIQQNWNKFLSSPLLKAEEKSAISKSPTLTHSGDILSSMTKAAFQQTNQIIGSGGAHPLISWRCAFLAAACGAAAGSGEIPFAIYIAGEIISTCG